MPQRENEIVLQNFKAVFASPLDRRNVHVKLQTPLEVFIKSQRVQVPQTLETVSITTFVVMADHLYNITVDSKLEMYVSFLNNEEKFVGEVVKIIPTADRFKLIIHLTTTPSIEKVLLPFISERQMQIIKELQEKVSLLEEK
jgi:hypothetical protein